MLIINLVMHLVKKKLFENFFFKEKNFQRLRKERRRKIQARLQKRERVEKDLKRISRVVVFPVFSSLLWEKKGRRGRVHCTFLSLPLGEEKKNEKEAEKNLSGSPH